MTQQQYTSNDNSVNGQNDHIDNQILDYMATIPSRIMFMPGVTRTDLKLYTLVKSLSRQRGYCYATNAYLGKFIGMNDRNVRLYLERLKKLAIIEVEVHRCGTQTSRKIWIFDNPRARENIQQMPPVSPKPPDVHKLSKEKIKPVMNVTGGEVMDVTDRLRVSDKEYTTSKIPRVSDDIAHRSRSQTHHHASYENLREPSANHFPDIHNSGNVKHQDWSEFRLEDGRPLSRRMQLALSKYKVFELGQLHANIQHYQERCRKGYQPPQGNHEKFLQACITYNYAGEQLLIEQNRIYAEWFIEENKLFKGYCKIMKTVVQFNRKGEKYSIPLNLDPDEFSKEIDMFKPRNTR